MSYFIIGSKNWPKWLSDSFNRFGIQSNYLEYVSLSAVFKLLHFKSDTLIRVGYRVGILKLHCILLDLYCFAFSLIKNKKVVVYWTGSDIQRTQKAVESSFYSSSMLKVFAGKRFSHITAAPWLVDELESIGISAKFLPFPVDLKKPCSFRKREKFEVLTYIPDSNYSNYHGETVIQLAKALPDVAFKVMGGNGGWVKEHLKNLTFLGWVTDTTKLYAESIVVLRVVEHDAMGGTVREALANGCYVIYTFPHEHTINVRPDFQDVLNNIVKLKRSYLSGDININDSAVTWVNNTLDESILVTRLIENIDGVK
ncbi:hypothetical protein [Pseudoalteromonas sp. ASV78]|uniref:hypothetical protein n=1 Tax=Pseudoalteromonas sp. ASV78 TaxID=3397851 RepID=UPI0039FCD502